MKTSFLYRLLFGGKPKFDLLSAEDALSEADRQDALLCDKVLPKAAKAIREASQQGKLSVDVYLKGCRLAAKLLEAAGYVLTPSVYGHTRVEWHHRRPRPGKYS